jgi:hypothetical protein
MDANPKNITRPAELPHRPWAAASLPSPKTQNSPQNPRQKGEVGGDVLEAKENGTVMPDLKMAAMQRCRVRDFTDGAVIGSKEFAHGPARELLF